MCVYSCAHAYACSHANISLFPQSGGAGFLPSDGLFFYKRMRVLNNGSLYLINAQLCDTQNISCHLVGNAGSVNAYSAALVVQGKNYFDTCVSSWVDILHAACNI